MPSSQSSAHVATGGDECTNPTVAGQRRAGRVANPAAITARPPWPPGHRVDRYRGAGVGRIPGRAIAPLAFQCGAAYNPASNSWRPISDNRWAHPGGMGAWVGGRMIVAAKNGGAEYDPAVDRWRDLPGAPRRCVRLHWRRLFWQGAPRVVHGAESGTIAVATYGPTGDTWMLGPSQPVSWSRGTTTDAISTVWTDHELVVWDGVGAGWAYDPTTATWRRLPDLTVANTAPAASSLAWVGNELLAVLTSDGGSTAGTGLRAARLIGDQWQIIADVKMSPCTQPTAVNVGGNLVVFDRSGQGAPMRADPSTGRWSTVATYPLIPGTDSTAVSTGAGLSCGADNQVEPETFKTLHRPHPTPRGTRPRSVRHSDRATTTPAGLPDVGA